MGDALVAGPVRSSRRPRGCAPLMTSAPSGLRLPGGSLEMAARWPTVSKPRRSGGLDASDVGGGWGRPGAAGRRRPPLP